MTREEIEERIRDNLAASGIRTGDVRVQPDPFGGWHVAVVSDEFEALSPAARRRKVLTGLEEADIEWPDLLTPDEADSGGGLPSAEPEESLPLWPEALARGTVRPEAIRFPSDLDEDLEPPVVVTFYSLRGGVGRSTALARTARLLARERKKVVCVDMDLEAPGLVALFACEDEITDDQGVVRLLFDLDQGEDPDLAGHLIQVSQKDDLYLLPAGKVGPNYARQLRFLDPTAWYHEDSNPLRTLMEGVREKLPFRPDAILVDARTGITPMSGPLLFELVDVAVVVVFPHPQAKRGTEMIVQVLLSSRTYRGDEPGFVPEVRFLASPIPNRSPDYEERALDWIADWMSDANEVRAKEEPIDAEDISLLVPYQEELASSDSATAGVDLDKPFEGIRDWVLRFLASPKEERISQEELAKVKPQLLDELEFSTGTAENQKNILENFVQTKVIRDAVGADIPLIRGRKGSGKTAIFRWLLESETTRSVLVHAPKTLWEERRWLLSPDGFHEVEKILERGELNWSDFWALYVFASLRHELDEPPSPPAWLDNCTLDSEETILNALESLQEAPRGPLELKSHLEELDRRLGEERLLLLDGLDTGFGHAKEERERRREAMEGLFGLWMDRFQSFTKLRLKILLREDIWSQLSFQNKSHLYGRSVLLTWPDRPIYFKVVLKQAMRSKSFRELLKHRDGGKRLVESPVDDWAEEDVWETWTVLVGERMKGGKTAFTRNWVWSRLADANDDHTPRYLLQLFHEGVRWEREQHRETPYERSVIRPRGLTRCLPEVSQQALEALREEFEELDPLLERLREIGRTPVDAGDLGREELWDSIKLAREVGLLGVYEERDEQVQRYKVPDLYRLALGMTRKGQA